MLATFQFLGGCIVDYDSDDDRWEDRASLDVGDHPIPNALSPLSFSVRLAAPLCHRAVHGHL
jgi:hypothetical protein